MAFFWPHFENNPTAPFSDICACLLHKGPMAIIDDAAFVCSYGDQAERSFGYRSSEPAARPRFYTERRQLRLWHPGIFGFTLILYTNLSSWPRFVCSVTVSTIPSISSLTSLFANSARSVRNCYPWLRSPREYRIHSIYACQLVRQNGILPHSTQGEQ